MIVAKPVIAVFGVNSSSLMIAILFGMTLQLSLGSGSYEYAILVALCGLGFAYDIE